MYDLMICALKCFLFIAFACVTCIFCTVYFLQNYFKGKRKESRQISEELKIAFFHPYCNSGGGGEKVLWHAVYVIQRDLPKVKIAIYTGDVCFSSKEITDRVKEMFDIDLRPDIEFVYLEKRRLIEAKRYPHFTLLRQSIGAMILSVEAIFSYLPDVYIDTTGWAFTLPVFSYLGGCVCASYVHYPTISTDMLDAVSSRKVGVVHNNKQVASSKYFSAVKIVYYHIFAAIYSLFGKANDVIMVNSSWTEGHIRELWKRPSKTFKVFPPCDTSEFKSLPMSPDFGSGEIRMVYLAQFRPEKDHALQLRSLAELKGLVGVDVWNRVKLLLVGSCRGEEDQQLIDDLKRLAIKLQVTERIEFKVNVPFEQLKQIIQSCIIGTHSMWNEHFGISVVECMASGLIMVAHNSGGPKADIVCGDEPSRTGYLASNEVEYAKAIAEIISLSPEQRMLIRTAARQSVDRFSNDEFYKSFFRAFLPAIEKAHQIF